MPIIFYLFNVLGVDEKLQTTGLDVISFCLLKDLMVTLHNFTTILKVSLVSSWIFCLQNVSFLWILHLILLPHLTILPWISMPFTSTAGRRYRRHKLGWLSGSSQFSHGHGYAICSSPLSFAACAKGAPQPKEINQIFSPDNLKTKKKEVVVWTVLSVQSPLSSCWQAPGGCPDSALPKACCTAFPSESMNWSPISSKYIFFLW